MLPDWLRVVPSSRGCTVFDERTGRFVVLDVPGAELAEHPRVRATGLLATPSIAESAAWVVHRKPHPLVLPARGALLAPDPARHGPGGWAWRLVPIGPEPARVLAALGAPERVDRLAERVGLGVEEALEVLAGLAAWAVQAVVLRPDRVRAGHPSLDVVGAARARNRREAGMYASAEPASLVEATRLEATSLGDFHDGIDDADTRFDLAETTLAHAFGVAHPALAGERYGARLCDRLLRDQPVGRRAGSTVRVVEVGGGTGELGEAFLARAAERGVLVRWLRVDRSPALLALQALRMPGASGLQGDALALPIPDGTVDLLIANEVIADLPSTRDRDGRWINDGALAFLGEIARVLAPGGHAFLSEFGSETDDPEETEQLDHPEVSIRFDRLVERSRELGLTADLHPVADWLGLDLDAHWLWRPHLAAVRHLDALAGRPLTPGRAWTPATLALPEPVDGLAWVTLRDEGPGPLPARTWVLDLRMSGKRPAGIPDISD